MLAMNVGFNLNLKEPQYFFLVILPEVLQSMICSPLTTFAIVRIFPITDPAQFIQELERTLTANLHHEERQK